MTDVASWERPHFAPGGGIAFLFYVLFGEFVEERLAFSRETYRAGTGVREFEPRLFPRAEKPEWVEEWLTWGPGQTLRVERPELFAQMDAAPHCLALIHEAPDPADLDYLRDMVGFVTYWLDHGFDVVLDPQIFTYYDPEEWKRDVFVGGPDFLPHHAVTLRSENEDGTSWFHTRGMRKFGRPDVGVDGVTTEWTDGAARMCARFCNFQALGALIPEGQEVRMEGVPSGGVVRHGGSIDDPDYNNEHFDIVFE